MDMGDEPLGKEQHKKTDGHTKPRVKMRDKDQLIR